MSDGLPPEVPKASAKTAANQDNPGGFAHMPALDGVRGTAILFVLFHHLFWSNTAAAHGFLAVFADIQASSYAGVNLFFALSGFLISGILIDTLDVPHYFRTFYARRTLRIFPLYYGTLILLLLLTRPLHMVWSGWQYYDLTYTANLAVWRPITPPYLGIFNINHFWSLQVEEQFYLIWPFIVFRVRRPAALVRISLLICGLIFLLRVFFVLMAGKPGFTNPYMTYSPTFSCADNILFGCCLAAVVRTQWRQKILSWAPYLLTACVSVLLTYGVINRGLDFMPAPAKPHPIFMPTLGFTLLGIGSTALIAMALGRGSKTERFLRNNVLRFFGRYSYGIYVFHYTLDRVLSGSIRSFLGSHLHSKALGVLGGAAAVTCASVLVALASYHLYEKHFLHLKKYFGYRRAAEAVNAA